MGRLCLIDAYSQIYRVFYAIRMLNNPAGEPVNALYGMARLFLQLDEIVPSEWGAIVFDLGKCVRRTALLPDYKAQRPPMPAELRAQTAAIRQWAQAFGWTIVQREGFEADDLICGLVGQRGDAQAVILSSDKDLHQLVQGEAVVMLAKGPTPKEPWVTLGEEAATRKFGLPPRQLGDYLALIGDNVDNIAGVAGVGPKTAIKLLEQFGDLDHLLASLEQVDAAKVRQALADSAEQLRRNRSLVQLDPVLPEGWKGLDGIRRRTPDWALLDELAAAQGFASIRAAIQKRQVLRRDVLRRDACVADKSVAEQGSPPPPPPVQGMLF